MVLRIIHCPCSILYSTAVLPFATPRFASGSSFGSREKRPGVLPTIWCTGTAGNRLVEYWVCKKSHSWRDCLRKIRYCPELSAKGHSGGTLRQHWHEPGVTQTQDLCACLFVFPQKRAIGLQVAIQRSARNIQTRTPLTSACVDDEKGGTPFPGAPPLAVWRAIRHLSVTMSNRKRICHLAIG